MSRPFLNAHGATVLGCVVVFLPFHLHAIPFFAAFGVAFSTFPKEV